MSIKDNGQVIEARLQKDNTVEVVIDEHIWKFSDVTALMDLANALKHFYNVFKFTKRIRDEHRN